MSGEITIREFVASDREAVRALLLDTFGSSEIYDRYDTRNPLGEPVRVVAELNGSIVGYNAWNAWLIYTPHGPQVVYQSGASAVGAVCRGQGVFGKLLAEGANVARGAGVACFIGFPNPASFKSFLRAGWTHASSLRLWVSSPAVMRCTLPDAVRATKGCITGQEESPVDEFAASFACWRYGFSGTKSIDFRSGGRNFRVFYREQKKHSLRMISLLDVVDLVTGLREHSVLTEALSVLPWNAGVVLRSNVTPVARVGLGSSARALCVVPIRRKWETPAISLPISDEGSALARELSRTTFWYGDIDIA